MLIIQTDGSFDQKTKRAAAAFIIKDFNSKEVIATKALLITATDNHQAEFVALILALEYLIATKKTLETIAIQSDSKGLIDAIDKNYSKNYSESLQEITKRLQQFNMYYTKLLADKENKAAHNLAVNILHH